MFVARRQEQAPDWAQRACFVARRQKQAPDCAPRPTSSRTPRSRAILRPMSRPRPRSEKKVRLRPADPFQLIRWLARSQPDPRKAVAELVQNSFDAGAQRVDVERRTIRGRRCLIV